MTRLWLRLCAWLEPIFPELGDWLDDDEDETPCLCGGNGRDCDCSSVLP